MRSIFRMVAMCSVATIIPLSAAHAQTAAPAWSATVGDGNKSGSEVVTYQPLAKAAKKWQICILFPHMKDTIWLAVDYGIIEEAKRLGVSATLYQAGGYENLPKQLSQFDDCMAGGYDAIIAGAISEAGLAKKFAEAKADGKPVIAVLNPIDKAEAAGKVFADNVVMGRQTGSYLAKYMNGKPANVVAFPGPAGSGWAEQFDDGFKQALVGHSNLKLLAEKFGDTGVSVQLGLVQNAMQAFPDMNVIWGTAITAEAAIGAIAEAGRPKTLIISEYENQAMLDALRTGKILAFATQFPVLQGRIAVDMAVRALEHKPVLAFAMPQPIMITADTLANVDLSTVLAPAGFEAVYSVGAH